MNWKDMGLRLFWTMVAAAGGAVGAVTVLDMDALKAALMVAMMAAVNFVTLVARQQLDKPVSTGK